MRYFTFKLSTNQPFSKLSIDIGIGIILSTGDNLESVQFFSFQTNSTDENKLIMKSAQWALLIAHSKIPANAHMPRRLYCILRMLYLVALTDRVLISKIYRHCHKHTWIYQHFKDLYFKCCSSTRKLPSSSFQFSIFTKRTVWIMLSECNDKSFIRLATNYLASSDILKMAVALIYFSFQLRVCLCVHE